MLENLSKKLIVFMLVTVLTLLNSSCRKKTLKSEFSDNNKYSSTTNSQSGKTDNQKSGVEENSGRKIEQVKIALAVIQFRNLNKYQISQLDNDKLKIFLPLDGEPLAVSCLKSRKKLIIQTSNRMLFSGYSHSYTSIEVQSPFLRRFQIAAETQFRIFGTSKREFVKFDGKSWNIEKIKLSSKINDLHVIKFNGKIRLIVACDGGLLFSDDEGKTFTHSRI